MSEETVLAPHIVSRPGVRGGRPRVEGTGVTVAFIAELHERMGVSVAEMCSEYDLSPADVHAAIAYYYDHREEIDAREAADRAWVEEFMRENSSRLQEKRRAYLHTMLTAEEMANRVEFL